MPHISVAESVLGVQEPTNAFEAVRTAQQTLTGREFTQAQLSAALENRNSTRPPHTRDEAEQIAATENLLEIFLDENTLTANTLLFWPSYVRLMQRHGQPADGAATALMLGSTNAISSRSFVKLAEEEYGAGESYIIDLLSGVDKTRQGNFVFGDALRIPFRSQSMDFIHTNSLLHMLEDPAAPSCPFRQRAMRLFGEISRVLAPGGQLLMIERIDDQDKDMSKHEILAELRKLITTIRRALETYGFEQSVLEPVLYSPDLGFLFDKERHFGKFQPVMPMRYIAVYARKPTRSVYEIAPPPVSEAIVATAGTFRARSNQSRN